jgi:hypothetical protein
VRLAVAKLSLAIEIAAPTDGVAVFFVPQRMPYWYGAEMQAEFTVLGGAPDFAPGQKVQIRGRLGRREVSITAVVAEYSFGRLLEWRFQDAYGVRGMQRWEIEPAGEGCVVRMRDEYELPGPTGRLMDCLLTRHAVRRRDLEYLERLKRLTERR